ncbi:DUF3833 domain-containing protein [Colwellia sp. E2M01]|nr:DUF3833 domain-containing protein [Colwellia sp. E2M01]
MLMFTLMTLSLAGCSANIADYSNTTPAFDIKTFFTGEFVANGMVQDYTNKVTRRFCVELSGTWDNNQGELAEVFYFHDGEISYRTWQLTKLPNDKYSGTAEDVIGTAYGQQNGYAFNWQYTLSVPIDGTTYNLAMDDWMYQLDENRVMNKTTMSKFGVDVAEITLFFDKSSTQTSCLNTAAHSELAVGSK